ncbi:hypothetical protein BDN70DRAFT_884955 [Pholiota conissans]|uniref:ARM repeat-containing protein n=1 Tax=Pholiota conissans TaxID=109636 RepID=A0A9P5YSI3_9AGAR|nr:hypothetical protein BDN70DRAFT_884955 [Pholiota conissans]
MDDDEISVADSIGEIADTSAYDKQRISLQTYLNSLPYECESVEDMQSRLEEIVEKIYICAKSKNWLVLSTWDGMLQCWLLMRYPMQKTTRSKLVRLYYELCLLPGIEPRILRSWADMLSRLLSNKPGLKKKLEPADLQLPWRPLWRVLQRELWPKGSLEESSRNLVNILLYVAEQCKRYYPASEIHEMLETFMPILTKETILTIVPVITSFLPPTHTHLYIAALFSLWEAFNSGVIDDRFLEFCGDLTEEHVSGPFGDAGDGAAPYKQIGIWTEAQWSILIGKGLGSMNVPVGAMRGASNTSSHADLFDKSGLKIKKSISKIHALAKIFVYSMAVDSEVRETVPANIRVNSNKLPQQIGYIAGSKALDSLDRLITSIESFFHPSNTGLWTLALTTFIQRLGAEFIKRWKEEEQEMCKTPVEHRLTPAIRRSFVNILKTPSLLAMFSKDPVSMSYAQGALRSLSMLEPSIIMPELLERAYGGLEVVNETHRTTAVLSMLSGIARPLVSEELWLGGQKHIVPLLELCIPGIDLNDPVKTVCSTMFIVSVVQHIKIGDLSQSGLSLSSDGGPGDDMMDVDDTDHLPDGTEIGDEPRLNRAEERSLVRDSTASFADWVVSLFRRVFALYENLPEEGGRKNTTGGKQEESVLKSIKSMLDVICLHLSDPLFDLVLNLVYEYATTNAKSNAVRAFGQLVACLARVRPEKTLAKFLYHCIKQVEEELKHGASSIRTTSTHAAVPSDTTLHWNMAILRGCLGYGGSALLPYKHEIIGLLALLVEKTKSERGYTGTGRMIIRILNTIGNTYPLNTRFVNTDEWDDTKFDKSHNIQWGRLYEPQDIVIEWHVPSNEEIAFVLEIIEQIGQPALKVVDSLISNCETWDNVARNDFCRYLHACRAIWGGLPTFMKEYPKTVANPCLKAETELSELLVSHLDVKAGFTLADPNDPRYQRVALRREQFGKVVLHAAATFRNSKNGEDHIDAVIGVTRAIDTYLLSYGLSRSDFDSMQKNYAQARDLNRSWLRQKDNSRLVFVKRAHVYHSGRVYMHALYRRRSALDDQLLDELVELSLSQYTRIRRQAQAVIHSVSGYYVRSTRYILPALFKALKKGNDPDRMKGALYILWNKGIAAYALADLKFHKDYLMSLLECQHEEKPSIQKLVGNLSQECLTHLNEEATHTDAYVLPITGVEIALNALELEFSASFVNKDILGQAMEKTVTRIARREALHSDTVSSILELALRPTTHWRYLQTAARFLFGLLRRDGVTFPNVAKFFLDQTTSPQPTIRSTAQRGIIKILTFVKIRSFSQSKEQLWLDEWNNPLAHEIVISDPNEFIASLNQPVTTVDGLYHDKIRTGFLTWTKTVKGYRPVFDGETPQIWESDAIPCLNAIKHSLQKDGYIQQLSTLWGQESNKSGSTMEVRGENILFFKYLARIFGDDGLTQILEAVDPLLFDSDKYKQRAGAEIICGLMRGSKHWAPTASNRLWSWLTSRLDRIVNQITPETLSFWETIFQLQLTKRDPRRNQPLVQWIMSLPLEFNGDSAFEMTKPLCLYGIMVEALGIYFNPRAEPYVKLLFDNANTAYAEIRQHVCHGLFVVLSNQWQPWQPSTAAFLHVCSTETDPLNIRKSPYMQYVSDILHKFPQWREERLAPPRVNQSEYDKVGLTLLQWIWVHAHGPTACLMFPYAVAMMPEILRMSELNDSSELQTYSSAVLYILSAVTPPVEFIEAILDNFVVAIKSSTSWRIRLHALPALVVFFYRNLLSISQDGILKIMDVLLDCLSDENVEVREMASKVFSGVVRCSQRQSIIPLKNRFVALARKTSLPERRDSSYTESLRMLHSAILGICALIESLPYSVEPWMPSLTEVLAPHATDPPPISTTIRKCASEFKKTHQDTWHKDQLLFDEDQLQSLSTMLVGTSYYA